MNILDEKIKVYSKAHCMVVTLKNDQTINKVFNFITVNNKIRHFL